MNLRKILKFLIKEVYHIMKEYDKRLVVKINRCPQNHPCPSVRVCPVNALHQNGFDAPTVDLTECIRCGKCVNFCPKRALVLE